MDILEGNQNMLWSLPMLSSLSNSSTTIRKKIRIPQPAAPRGRDNKAPIYIHSAVQRLVASSRDDLQNKIIDSVSEEDKLASTEEMHSLIDLAQNERDLYISLIKKAKEMSHLFRAER
ncbi:hypothetical protein DPMN_190616 [Dreissena polymorpha]|uniref:Uncharacterized protein n=1 Tax=Dreissena polymorpha TaxID=45954 RepID=A0A9D3Y0R7_DREPO|nr:hypothetical protein DPMN_190616 [Dreissena polymorpha]